MSKEKGFPNKLIIVVDNSVAITGALNAIRHATGALREQYRFLYVLPSQSTAYSLLIQDGYAVHELPFVEISRDKIKLLSYIPMLLLNGWRLWRIARQAGADVIHVNDFYNLTGYVAKFLSLGQIQVVIHVRFLPQTLPQPLAQTWRWLSEMFADQVVCVSEAVRRYFSTADKVQVIFDPIPAVEKYAIPGDELRHSSNTVQLLYLSNYIQGKGQNFALEAFKQAYANDNQLRLTFAGGDMGLEKNRQFRRQLEGEVQSAGLNSVISFKDFVSDVEQVIKGADIVLNFSESESFSLTCLDALYFGTPLIASDCGGPAELFENGISGLLVPNRDVAAMAAAINLLAADAVLRAKFAAAGRRFVRHKFHPSATFEQLGSLYRRLTNSR